MSYKYLVIDTITGIVSASDGSVNPANRINIDNVDGAGTAAKLDSGISPGNVIIVQNDGKISCDVLPDISIIETFVINSEEEMLALIAQQGDICIREDINKSFILKNSVPSILSNWQELKFPLNAVISINGKTGVVTLNTALVCG